MREKKQHQFLKYMALGDSLTVGVGASFLAPGFVSNYARLTEAELNARVFVDVYARSGIETGEVLKIVENPCLHEKIKHANIITLSAGGNDLISASKVFADTGSDADLQESLKECRENVGNIITIVKELKKDCGEPYMIRILNLYNPLPELPLSDKWVRLFNRHLNSFDDGSLIRVANIYSIFKGREDELLSRDRIHPNNRGYEEIAYTLLQLGYKGID
ncbi:GDSL-type esterase/lipase family protein [Metabacillus herbersteinensis]|uniref:GDSL-type esterase/lipase family protein n=2 Tax=Metabacillus herbersteinensis TaxID=283816 RepID=A0ABV6GE63_9BACI